MFSSILRKGKELYRWRHHSRRKLCCAWGSLLIFPWDTLTSTLWVLSAEVLARAPQTHMFFLLVVGHFFSLNFLAANSRGWRYLICTSRSPYTPHPRSFFVPASDRKMKRPRHTRLALRLCFPDFLSSVCVCVCVAGLNRDAGGYSNVPGREHRLQSPGNSPSPARRPVRLGFAVAVLDAYTCVRKPMPSCHSRANESGLDRALPLTCPPKKHRARLVLRREGASGYG